MLTAQIEHHTATNLLVQEENFRLTNAMKELECRLAITAEQRRSERQQRYVVEQECSDLRQHNDTLQRKLHELQESVTCINQAHFQPCRNTSSTMTETSESVDDMTFVLV